MFDQQPDHFHSGPERRVAWNGGSREAMLQKQFGNPYLLMGCGKIECSFVGTAPALEQQLGQSKEPLLNGDFHR